jgi:carbon monoxide dehydrogenase subunit G
MADRARQGCLVLADIGGYTAYLSGVELEHSHDILADLLGTVSDALCPPLRLAKLEGDAVFCVSEPARQPAGEELLGAIEQTYLRFARRRRTVSLSSSCTCEACRRTPQLELKFCLHHGSFVEHEVAGSRELLGPDVILVHRLLKNSVAQTHGMGGYALMTDACVQALDISRSLTAHSERYDDVGEVHGAVLDLGSSWRRERDQTRSVVSREQAALLFEADVRASQQQVWEAMTDPAQGMHWRVGVDDIREQGPQERGAGTVTHCVHGRTTIRQEIRDWLPPHHYTFSEHNPAGACEWTVSLAPVDSGRTHIEWRIALTGGRRQALLMRVIGGRMRKILQENFDSLIGHVERAGA